MPQVNGDCGASSGAPAPNCGVWGDCDTRMGVVGTSNRGEGVVGTSNRSTGVRGRSEQARGVRGDGARYGVHGYSWGQGSDTDPSVYAGVYAQGNDFGVYCRGALLGLYSEGAAQAGFFNGPVYVNGAFTVFSPHPKSVAVPHPDGRLRKLYTLESPESWFEDFGRAEVIEGHAQVELDGDFAAMVDTDDYHVFVTPEGESNGLYVSERTPRGFEVREQGEGTSTLAFSYRIVVKRKDVEAERLEAVERPPERTLAEVEPPDLEQESQ
jgi:hypothetical protein